MNKSNIQNKKQTKNVTVYATISVMVAFALVASPFTTMNAVYANSDLNMEKETNGDNDIGIIESNSADNMEMQSTHSIMTSDGRGTYVDDDSLCGETNEDYNEQVCTPDDIFWCYDEENQVCEVAQGKKGIGISIKQ
ncbi:MAG: hypothetical protein R2685_15600 [Candidatus Nitrosocosmicus sp.]|nr:hypothetical protein [Candidatus Nitrosocosmicus sp.]